ncbi:MAG: PPOX class F420-dependent oxidoreductase [Actinomycetota bacterium]|nr:PPOX class F420-dependent oxidoreductase [Actinomycetota bacterium]MDQ3788538.1 PPOX class F420-dependent oxidoreductase [Actinomycetota bacterium]
MTTTQQHAHDAIGALARERTVLLTTFRRDGTPVATPVHIAPGPSVAYARTFDPSGKVKRLRRSPEALAAPCTFRGRVTGPTTNVVVRELQGDDAERAAAALAAKYPFLHGRLIPWLHRVKGVRTVHLELCEP